MRWRGGFTLIEVLGVILLTGLVLGAALDFYLDLAHATQRAADGTRDVRHAAALLDRVARDLQAAVLLEKPPELDPLSHPWVFLAESRYAEDGADHLKFMTRRRKPLRSDVRESDFAVVAYQLQRSEAADDLFELRRWSSPRLPEGLDREFPSEGGLLVAEGVESFRLRFLADDGAWVGDWDSSQLVESSELPVAVEVEVSLVADGAPEPPFGVKREPAPRYARMVVLPLRPLDMTPLLPVWAGGVPAAVDGGFDEEGVDLDGDGIPDVIGSDGESRRGKTIGYCVVNPPHGDTGLGQAWADFVATNANKPLSAHRWLFADENLRPECR